MVEFMKQSHFDGVVERRRWKTLLAIFECEESRLPETIRQRRVLAADVFAKQMANYAECLSESARLTQPALPVVIAMREALELPISENVYVQALAQSPGILREPMREFLENLEQFVTTKFGAVEEQN
jgi:hypothetical protein